MEPESHPGPGDKVELVETVCSAVLQSGRTSSHSDPDVWF